MQAGQVIADRYRLEERVGAGGGGTVWRAADSKLPRNVAVKHVLSADSGHGTERVERLLREADALARLNHPHVVTLFDVAQEGTEWWLVMEYIPSGSLADQGTLPPERAARLGVQIADALEAVHGAGLVHGDVKPGNVLVTEDGRAKLADFGASRTVHAEVTLTKTGGLVAGTPAFIAPEVADGADPVPASDVFGLGAALFAAVEGQSPYGPEKNPMVVLRKAAERRIATSQRGGPLTPVLAELMHGDPAGRPTAGRARRLLEPVAASSSPEDGAVPVDTGPSGTLRPNTGSDGGDQSDPEPIGSGGRRRRRTAVVAGAAAAALGLGAWLIFDPPFGGATPNPRPSRTAAPSVFGDPHTVDPCSLQNEAKLARFGSTGLDTAYGDFNRCDVVVHPHGGGEVDVKAELLNPDSTMDTSGRPEKVGAIQIWKEPDQDGDCTRLLLLPDKSRVEIEVQFNDKASVNLCAITDTAVDSAVAVLSRGTLPRRATPPVKTSLFWSDACSLADAKTLSRFPGVDATHPDIGFGNWECTWGSTTSHTDLTVRFDQGGPLTADDGHVTKLGGHEAYVDSGYDDKACAVRVPHRRFTTVGGDEKTEQLLIIVGGEGSSAWRCRVATDVAGPIAAKLPGA
ncbi:serine/threonine-protein kinase [Actinoallomurus sp. CA-150999]|uniref:serine/threonine-protein kinase n=1 Tax=Actinoallomurus sp. CA-150999 TaxID=3239887 RepID=UPI003D90AF70